MLSLIFLLFSTEEQVNTTKNTSPHHQQEPPISNRSRIKAMLAKSLDETFENFKKNEAENKQLKERLETLENLMEQSDSASSLSERLKMIEEIRDLKIRLAVSMPPEEKLKMTEEIRDLKIQLSTYCSPEEKFKMAKEIRDLKIALSTSVSPEEKLKMKEEIKHLNEQIAEMNYCTICYEHKLDCALNCGHVFCQSCTTSFRTCPMCRTNVTQTLVIFLDAIDRTPAAS